MAACIVAFLEWVGFEKSETLFAVSFGISFLIFVGIVWKFWHRDDSETGSTDDISESTEFSKVDNGMQSDIMEDDVNEISYMKEVFEYEKDINIEDYFIYCENTADKITDYIQEVMNDEELFEDIKNIGGIDIMDVDLFNKYNSRVVFIVFHDLWKCFEGMGYDITEEKLADLCCTFVVCKLTNNDFDSRILRQNKELWNSSHDMCKGIMSFVKKLEARGYEAPTAFLMETMYEHLNRSSEEYINFLKDVSTCMAMSEGEMTEKATLFINSLQTKTEGTYLTGDNVEESIKSEACPESEFNTSENRSTGIVRLEELVGLKEVKVEVRKLHDFIKVRQLREKEGLKSPVVSYHCVFTGNPGTGKTTVARIIAEVYKELGILKSGHLVETDRAGLIAEYVGQTAVKTNKIIDKAIDGVLFIDEAYSLLAEGTGEYGNEAIATLLKRMEDDRERLIVILAGYNDEMTKFINSNPGLRSRFNRYFHFADYSANELWRIFLLNVSRHDYILGEGVEDRMKKFLDKIVMRADPNFGNARFIRNLFEKILENQAARIASEGYTDRESLQRIVLADIENLTI